MGKMVKVVYTCDKCGEETVVRTNVNNRIITPRLVGKYGQVLNVDPSSDIGLFAIDHKGCDITLCKLCRDEYRAIAKKAEERIEAFKKETVGTAMEEMEKWRNRVVDSLIDPVAE